MLSHVVEGTPGVDLALYLVERLCSKETEVQTANALVVDYTRASQLPYSGFLADTGHRDGRILTVQKCLEKHYSEKTVFSKVAERFGMSRRSFERRFKNATGDTPIRYLQHIRVESAKILLTSGRLPFERIACEVGYESPRFSEKFLSGLPAYLPDATGPYFAVIKQCSSTLRKCAMPYIPFSKSDCWYIKQKII